MMNRHQSGALLIACLGAVLWGGCAPQSSHVTRKTHPAKVVPEPKIVEEPTPPKTAPPVKQSEAAKTIEAITAFYQKGKITPIGPYIKNSRSIKLLAFMEKAMQKSKTKTKISVHIEEIEETGNTARAVVVTTASSPHQPQPRVITETVNLEKLHGRWLVVAPLEQHDNTFFNLLAYMMVWTSAGPTGRGPIPSNSPELQSPATVCAVNIKQLGSAILMYVADHKGQFKLNANNWMKVTAPYFTSAQLLTCPVDPKGMMSYSFNDALTGKSLDKIQSSAVIVLLYEGKNRKLNFRHGGRASVVFADGHSMLMSAEESKQLYWKP